VSGPIDPVALARDLIRCPSVTPEDAGALDVLQRALEGLGFACHRLPFEAPGTARIDNLYARRGEGAPNFCFAGHTDVVPPGDTGEWSVDPFAAEVRDGWLIGRGAADMKAAVACMVAAAGDFLERRGDAFGGAVSFLITGDEEGPAVNGTVRMLDWLRERGERLDACLVGEPTSVDRVGDTAKIGRRGSLNGVLFVRGAQGHTAYPHLADNPIPRLLRMLAAITDEPLDDGSEHFQPSTLEITTVDVGNPATNVIPGKARAAFNVRFNDRHDAADVERWLRRHLDAVGGDYQLEIAVSGESFLTPPGPLTDVIVAAAEQATGMTPDLSTSGGTSDARFIKDLCPVAELGMTNATAHKTDERVALDDLAVLTAVYRGVLDRFFAV
jgi:succinyl-diaminopimelate desuccinylase